MSSSLPERSREEWAQIEAKAHDGVYAGSTPFGQTGYRFTVDEAVRYLDYCYKPNRAYWGHRSRKFLERVEPAFLPGKRLLDIGSGNGQMAVLYAMYGADVVGIELSAAGTEVGRKTAEANGVADRCTFITGDFTATELDDESFDVVTMHATLHHLIKYPGLKEKVFAITKPGGRVVISDTVRGGGLLHQARKAVRSAVYLRKSVRQEEAEHGDVLFGVDQYRQFAEGFSECRIDQYDYFYMINKVIERIGTKALPARAVLWCAKHADDVLAAVVPPMRSRFGNAVVCLTK